MPKPRRPQPLLLRLTHWVHVPVFVVMAASGLQILRAYPYFGPVGDRWTWVPLQGWMTPEWMRAGAWLAGARHLHFLFAWILVINAGAYLGYAAWRGELRRRVWWPRVPGARYSTPQRLAYTAAWGLGVLEVLSGFAIWKPVQLHWLATAMGGYDGARVVHFLALLGLLAFLLGHVVMVALRPRTLVAMVTGGPRAPADDEAA